MLFNSLAFLVFLPIVFIVYWFILHGRMKAQNSFILVASYVFYGWWDWRFLALIIISSATDYFIGRKMGSVETPWKRRLLLIASLSVNLGLLGFFKYFNFFVESFADLLEMFGLRANYSSLRIILPVGISFYTFQTLSYTIDIYNRKIKPTRDVTAFFAFVSYFPQLVAGPIERAKNLLPQFHRQRNFINAEAVDGLKYMLWGMFKKVVIADNAAIFVDNVFSDPSAMNSGDLIIGIIFFAFQIYGDFSGYSDIAIGVSKLFGIKLMKNFDMPYFSRNIGEFWRRWHISLSTWFRDYVFIPLGGSRGKRFTYVRNIMLTFTISGFWHGANWTFIVWGILHGVYYLPLIYRNTRSKYKKKSDNYVRPGIRDAGKILATFAAVLFAWVFFRASSIGQAMDYITGFFNQWRNDLHFAAYADLVLLMTFVIFEWYQRDKHNPLELKRTPRWLKWLFYSALVIMIMIYYRGEQSFIYFQF